MEKTRKIIGAFLAFVAVVALALFALYAIGTAIGNPWIEARLAEAEAETLRNRANLTDAQADLEIAEAEAYSIRRMTDEMVGDSRMVRRLLVLGMMRNLVLGVLIGWASAIATGAGLFAWIRKTGTGKEANGERRR